MKYLGFIVGLLLLALQVNSWAITSVDTNMEVMGNDKSLYGHNTSRMPKQLIGVNGSNLVSIDEGALGVLFGGALTSTGAFTASGTTGVGTFLKFSNATTCSPSAETAATVTPVGTRQIIAGAAAISTVNVVASTNISTGTIVIFKTNDSSKDVVFAEGGNLLLGAASRTLSDVADRLTVIWDAASNKWVELFFSDNN